MIDLTFLREHPEVVQKAATDKKVTVDIEIVLALDKAYREISTKVQKLREEKNTHTATIQGKPTPEQIEKGKKIKEELDGLEKELHETKASLDELLLIIPNIPDSSVPFGKDESENVEIRKWGEPTKLDFEPLDHLTLGEKLGIIETQKAAKIAGARFAYLMGDGALLEFALVQHAFSVLTNPDTLQKIANSVHADYTPRPFVPVVPPVMIRPDIFEKMARINPRDERYYLQQDDMFLIGSAEHTLGPLHMDETIAEKDLPIRYVGFSTAFRREAGSYGKDMKGILRVHQFDKIEMESFATMENAVKEQDFFVAIQEYLMQSLEIPHRVMMICTGDMGGPDARQLDIESWIPSQNKYRETHTSDMMTDYQSRRLNTRVRKEDGTTEYVAMNDATAFAVGRTIIAILENYQQKDGSVVVPEVLRKYIGKDIITSRK
ncbi:serine--tRNA ligase [soil metagenome]